MSLFDSRRHQNLCRIFAVRGPPLVEKFQKCLILLALPREAREVSKLNNLRKGLGRECLIELQYVSASTPNPLGLHVSQAAAEGGLA